MGNRYIRKMKSINKEQTVSRNGWLQFVGLALILMIGLLAGCGQQEATPQAEGQGSTMSGLTLLNDRCTECHTLDRVTSASKTREEWNETVTAMVRRGADLDEQEQEVLVEYLASTYGP